MQQRFSPAGKVAKAAAAQVGRCSAPRPFHGWRVDVGRFCRTHKVMPGLGWNALHVASRKPLGLLGSQQRFAASAGDDKPKDGVSVPAVGSSAEISTKKEPVEVESIEEILRRSQRKQLIERVGPQVERYLPTEDPGAFLLPPERLTPSERWWQKVFVATFWTVLACMLATPLLMVRGNLPFLQKRAEEEREAAAERAAQNLPEQLPGFEVVNFGQMPDVLERPFPTMVMLFDPSTYMSQIFLAALRDLTQVLQVAGVAVSIVALDLTASPQPPPDFLWEYPPALAPHLQLVVPRVRSGEAGLVEYEGRWTATALAEAARSLAGPYPAAVPPEELSQIDARIEKLRDTYFELLFLDDPVDAVQTAGRPPWWRRTFAKPVPSPAFSASRAMDVSMEFERRLDFNSGLDAAIQSCQIASEDLRSGATPTLRA